MRTKVHQGKIHVLIYKNIRSNLMILSSDISAIKDIWDISNIKDKHSISDKSYKSIKGILIYKGTVKSHDNNFSFLIYCSCNKLNHCSYFMNKTSIFIL